VDIPLTTDTTPVALVSQSGERYEIAANLWQVLRWMAAEFGGWRPAGTAAPEGWDEARPWKGEYDPATGQVVGAADAAALAEGIAKASSMFEALMRLPPGVLEESLRSALGPGDAARLLPSVLPYSPGQDRGRDFRLFILMEEVGDFCRKGAFRVG
jgi:hypothetical protein